MTPQGDKGSLAAFVRSFGYAASGIATAFRKGRNFKVQLGFAVLAIVLGAAFRVTAPEWLAIVVCIGAVLGGECVNTSIEDVVDLVSPEYHPLAKSAKDLAAGGVLVMSVASVAVAAIVFLPRLLVVLGVA